VSVWLLDVNVLVARFWESHAFHRVARAWMASHEQEGWATCPITQAGLVRTISNPGFSPDAPTPAEAMYWLAQTINQHPSHQFWADDLPLSALSASVRRRLHGPGQITDAYLLTLAIHHKAKLATFDARMLALAPEGSAERGALVLLQ
jgi:hypothetical protein